MEPIRFPSTCLVQVQSRICQIATFVAPGTSADPTADLTADPATLSEEAQELVQQLVWTSIVSPPANGRVQLQHPEFDLCITARPWRLASKYTIVLDGQERETTPHKLWFVLSVRDTRASPSAGRAAVEALG